MPSPTVAVMVTGRLGQLSNFFFELLDAGHAIAGDQRERGIPPHE